MIAKRFLALAMAGLLTVTSFNTGSLKVYAQEAEQAALESSSVEESVESAEDGIETDFDETEEVINADGTETEEVAAPVEESADTESENEAVSDETLSDGMTDDSSTDVYYTLTLNANGGLFENEEDTLVIQVKADSVIEESIDAPVRDGFLFEGWYLDEALSEEVDLSTYIFTDNAVLFAAWQEASTEETDVEEEDNLLNESYSFTLNANIEGGKFPNGESTYVVKSETTYLTSSAYKPAAEGWCFKGWYADPECNTLLSLSDVPDNSSGFTLKEAPENGAVLYAGWVNTYKLTFIFGTETGTDPVKDLGYWWDHSKKVRVKKLEYVIPAGLKINNSKYYPSSLSYIRNADLHYKFTSWYSDEDRQNKISNLNSVEPKGPTTFYAGFEDYYDLVTCHNIDDTAYFIRSNILFTEVEDKTSEVFIVTNPKNNRNYFYTKNIGSYAKSTDPKKAVEGYYLDSAGKTPVTVDQYGNTTIEGDTDIYLNWADTNKVLTLDAGDNGNAYFVNDEDPQDTSRRTYQYGDAASEKKYIYPPKLINKDPHKKFVGWGTTATATEPAITTTATGYGSTNAEFPMTDDATYYAIWESAYHVVTFDPGEGATLKYYDSDKGYSVVDANEAAIRVNEKGKLVSNGITVTPPENTLFVDWYNGTEKVRSLSSQVFSQDTTLTAKYIPVYTITLDAMGGTFTYYDEDKKETVNGAKTGVIKTDKDGELKYAPSNITAPEDGFIFEGWYIGDEKIKYISSYKFTESTTLTAHYRPVYTITLEGNGGKFNYSSNNPYESHENATNAILKTGSNGEIDGYINDPVIDDPKKVFEAWYDGDTRIESINSYVPVKDTVIKAHYAEAVTITLHANGGYFGSGDNKTETKTYIVAKGTEKWLTTPSYENDAKEFGGYYEHKDPWSDKLEDRNYVAVADIEFYARWYDRFAITFDYGEGSLNGEITQTFQVTENETFGQRHSVPANPTTIPEGRAFVGWFTEPNTVADDKKIEKADILEHVVTGPKTFYAGYKNAYQVTFDVGTNKGKFASKTGGTYTVNVAQYEAIKGKVPTVVSTETKVFEGWFTSASGDGEEIKNVYTYKVTDNLTLYARFTECYTITFHGNMEGTRLDGVSGDIVVRVVKGTPYRYGKEGSAKDVLFEGPRLDYSSVNTSKLPYISYDYSNDPQAGWCDNPNGTGNVYFFGEYGHRFYDEDGTYNSYNMYGYVPTKSMDFYVKWAEPVKVTFDANGSKFKESSSADAVYGPLNADKTQRTRAYAKGTRYRDINEPGSSDVYPREGYYSPNWPYTDRDGKNYFGSNKAIDGDKIFYARWYKSGGSSGGGDSEPEKVLTLHSGEGYFSNVNTRTSQIEYSGTSSTNDRYTTVPSINDENRAFLSWYKDESLTKPYPAEYQSIKYGDDYYILIPEDITDLYAKYGTAYTVKIDANGGYFDKDDDRTKDPDESMRDDTLIIKKQSIVGSAIIISDYTKRIRRDGNKIFGGWYTDENCTEKAVLSSDSSSYEYFTPTQNTTLYAKWIDYDLPDGEITASADKTGLKIGEKAKLTSNISGARWFINSSSYNSGSDNPFDLSPIVLYSDGTVEARKAGTATVYAEYNGKRSKNIEFTVSKGTVTPTLIVNKSSVSLIKNEQTTITATVTPSENARKVTWKSSDTNIVAVTGSTTSGNQSTATIVGGGKEGKATITVSDGTNTKKVEVTVSVPLKLNKNASSITVKEGAEETLTLSINSEALSDKSVIWSSSDTAVLTVTADAQDTKKAVVKVVNGVSLEDVKTVTITAQLEGTEYSDVCKFTVSPESGLILDKEVISLVKNSEATVTAKVVPASLQGSYTWKSADTKVATIAANGNTATIRSLDAEGTTTVTVTYGKLKKEITVIVAEPIVIAPGAVSLNFVEGNSSILEAVVSDDHKDKKVIWTSSNRDILHATAEDELGRKAVVKVITTATVEKETIVTITATLEGTDYSATSVVTIRPLETVKAPMAYIGEAEGLAGGEKDVAPGTIIELKSETYGALIFYTITEDGSEPAAPVIDTDEEGNPVAGAGTVLYNGSFTLTKDVTRIKAVAAQKSLIDSSMSEFKLNVKKNDWGDIKNETSDLLAKYLKDEVFKGDSRNIKDQLWYVFGNDIEGYQIAEEPGKAGNISKTYTGDKITFNDEIYVFSGNRRLVENRDYTVAYTNNVVVPVSAKLPTVTLKGKGNYKFSSAFTFAVTEENLAKAVVTSEHVVTILSGAKLTTVKPQVIFGTKKLAAGKDYELRFYSDKDCKNQVDAAKEVTKAGSYFIQIAAKGTNFAGVVEKPVEVRVIPKTDKNAVQVSKLKVAITDANGKAAKLPYDKERTAAELKAMLSSPDGQYRIVVTNGKTVLKQGLDYTVDFRDESTKSVKAYESAGKHNIVICGRVKTAEELAEEGANQKQYIGEKTASLEITGTLISKAKVAGLKTSVEYTGAEITLSDLFNESDKNLKPEWKQDKKPVLYAGTDKFTEGDDYQVTYKNTGVVGKFDLVYTGINGCTGTLKKTITVKAHGMTAKAADITVIAPESVTYVKSGAKPKVTVMHGTRVLTEGVDYTVTYKNNTKVFTDAITAQNVKKAPTAVIKGMGNYSGSGKSVSFRIEKAPLSQVKVVANDVTFDAKKSGKSGYMLVVPKLLDDGKAVTNGKNKDIDAVNKKTDYSYFYQVATTLGNGDKKAAGDPVGATDKVPAGTIIRVEVTVNIAADNKNTPYTKDTDKLVGYYRVLKDKSYDISKYNVVVKDPSILYFEAGKQIRLTESDLKVYSGKGAAENVLEAGSYEIVSFTDSYKVGTASLVIRGLGEYGGTKTIKLKIVARTK